jgi:transposase-like protein
MDKEFRNEMIKAAKEYGGSIRQLLRLTGLSYGLIRKVS